jgi:hypothetical protein
MPKNEDIESDRRRLHELAKKLTPDDRVYITIRKLPSADGHKFETISIHIEKDAEKLKKIIPPQMDFELDPDDDGTYL